MKHTILGAGGSIGNTLATELLANGEEVRLVSRSGFQMDGAESLKGDLSDSFDTMKAVEGSDVVYLCAGLPYDHRTWKVLWPKIMQNTIDACKENSAKLIFFDNVYMYGKVEGKMTETTPYNPCSLKGEIRAKIARQLEDEMNRGNISASIARAADLYGPHSTKTGMLHLLVIEKLINNKKAQWMINENTVHSLTYTVDCAKAMRLMAHDDSSFNQIWHLPTAEPAINGKAFIDLVAKGLDSRSDYMVLKKWMVKTFGFFNHTVSELVEMAYQNEFDYQFDSSKFNHYFNFTPTSYNEGVKQTIQFLKTPH